MENGEIKKRLFTKRYRKLSHILQEKMEECTEEELEQESAGTRNMYEIQVHFYKKKIEKYRFQKSLQNSVFLSEKYVEYNNTL